MADIQVGKSGDGTYRVVVSAKETTTHQVTLTPDYYQKLTGGSISEEELIRRSFEFLLRRESNSMILSRFELPVIQGYFPEYERQIAVGG